MNTAIYSDRIASDAFPGAMYYRSLFPMADRTLHEAARRRTSFAYTERHLQCVWFDAALRPDPLITSHGERVIVESPGTWNLEAGPDFIGAALLIGPDRRRMSGDVEVHIHPADWIRHQHRADSRYGNVRVHACYAPGALRPEELPPGAVQISLRDGLTAHPSFSFETIDLTAYPYAARSPGTPCSRMLVGWSFDDKQRLLMAAGEERLRRKAERMADAFDQRGREQVFYEEFMTGLGYKNNKRPFRHLAATVPLEHLREVSAGDRLTGYALLAGVSGLLPDKMKSHWDAETKSFVRGIWNRWWKHEDRLHLQRMGGPEWRTDGARPTNHPLRRMMAAAMLFSSDQHNPLGLTAPTAPGDPAIWGKTMMDALEHATDSYWIHRLALGGKRHEQPISLLGGPRVSALMVNVVLPYLAAAGIKPAALQRMLEAMPAEPDSRIVLQTAHDLFGPDHPPSLYRNGLARQGLIQIFHDFCLNDRSRCGSCLFPHAMKK